MSEALAFAASRTAAAPPTPVARPPLRVTWHSFDLRTGARGQQLPAQQPGSFSRILCEASDSQVAVRIVPGWDEATLPGRTMLVALDQEEKPVWGGLVFRRVSDAGDWSTCSIATLEAYFDRRFVTDQTYTSTGQTLIAEGLIDSVATDGVELVVDATASTHSRDRAYFEDEDKTVLSVLQELAGVEGGIEFTVDLDWTDTGHNMLKRTMRVADRIGTATDTPTAVFTMPGSVKDFSYVEDFSSDHGANAVRAVSSGEGDTRPESRWMTALQPGWARFERIITPSTSIIDAAVLDAHAHAEVAQTWDGMNELTLEANLQTAPRVGEDWYLGDDVGAALTCPRFPQRMDADGAVVPGYQAVVRAIGWEMDLDADVIKPRLLEATPVDVEAL